MVDCLLGTLYAFFIDVIDAIDVIDVIDVNYCRSPRRRSDSSRSKVESVEDALAVMRARKVSEELSFVILMDNIDSRCEYDDSIFNHVLSCLFSVKAQEKA